MVEVVSDPQPMYNLTVADAHTFFVGDGQWLVHNTDPSDCLNPKIRAVEKHSDWKTMKNNDPSLYKGWEGHHGITAEWMERNYPKYNRSAAPVIIMPASPNHHNTRGILNTWRAGIKREKGWGTMDFDWRQITEDQIMELADTMCISASIDDIWNAYLNLHRQYLESLR